MMMWKIVVVVACVLLAGFAVAALPVGEKVLSTDATVITQGVSHVVIRADGTAAVRIYSRATRYPYSASGDTVYTVRDGEPAPFSAAGGIDSVKIVFDDATEVIVTWGSW
jgi:hypothetical protein